WIPLRRLRIGEFELDVVDPSFGGLAAGILDEVRRGVGAERETSCSNELCQSLSRIAKSATDIDAGPAHGRREALEALFGHLVQRAYEHAAVRFPALVKDRIPGAHCLLVGHRHRTGELLLHHRRSYTSKRLQI